jgi:hypothetical protein
MAGSPVSIEISPVNSPGPWMARSCSSPPTVLVMLRDKRGTYALKRWNRDCRHSTLSIKIC